MRTLATRHDDLTRAARFAADAHAAARDVGALVPPFDQQAAHTLFERVTGHRDTDAETLATIIRAYRQQARTHQEG